MNSVQYTIAETVLQRNLRENLGANLHESQGVLPASSPLTSDGSQDCPTGG